MTNQKKLFWLDDFSEIFFKKVEEEEKTEALIRSRELGLCLNSSMSCIIYFWHSEQSKVDSWIKN